MKTNTILYCLAAFLCLSTTGGCTQSRCMRAADHAISRIGIIGLDDGRLILTIGDHWFISDEIAGLKSRELLQLGDTSMAHGNLIPEVSNVWSNESLSDPYVIEVNGELVRIRGMVGLNGT